MKPTPDQACRFLRVMEPLTPCDLDLDDLAACLAVFEHVRDFATQPAPVVFEFAWPQCRVNGEPIRCQSKGIVIAWAVLATEQYRLGEVRVEWFFPGARAAASALQAIQRAAQDVSRYSPALAAALAAIGTSMGRFVLKSPARGIRCTSPMLAQAVRVTSA